MKAFLKAQDGSLFTLAPKVTTIGREGCDLTIQMPGVDYQHAVVEYCEDEDCLILQDLNTAQGTYVNDVRVQNAAVRLAPHDRVRFGYNGQPYELLVEQTSVGVTCPPVQQRQAWNGGLTILNEAPVYTNPLTAHTLQQPQHHNGLQQHLHGQYSLQQPQPQQQQLYPGSTASGLPVIPPTPIGPTSAPPATSAAPSAGLWLQTAPCPAPQAPVPRPPLRSRPLSAGSARRPTFDVPRFQLATRQATVGGWVSGISQRGKDTTTSVFGLNAAAATATTTAPSPALDLAQLQAHEKDQRLAQLMEELTRLRNFEFESYRKDQLIEQLQRQVADVQSKLRQEPSVIMGGGDPDASHRLAEMEKEVDARKAEVAALKEQLVQRQAGGDGAGSPIMLRQELGERMKEVASLRAELERVKKDKNLTSSLVTQMQRDVSSKDSTVSKMSREIEALKRELREKDKHLASANAKMTKTREMSISSKGSEERDAREKELISLRQRFKGAENKISEQFNAMAALKEEVETLKSSLQGEKEGKEQSQKEADDVKSQLAELQAAEKSVRHDLEQAVKATEQLKTHVVQTTFTTADMTAPDTAISDDDLMDTLKSLLQERSQLLAKVKDLEVEVAQVAGNVDTLHQAGQSLRAALQESLDRVSSSGRLTSALKEEVGVVQSLSCDGGLQWVRDMAATILSSDLAWQETMEEALLKCDISCKFSSEDPAKHIELLHAKWESERSEKDRLTTQIAELEAHYEEDYRIKLEAQNKDADTRLKEMVDKVKLEGEEKLNKAIEEVFANEEEKLRTTVAEEKKHAAELEASLEQLRQALRERQEEDQTKLDQASVLVTEVEQFRILEQELRNQILLLEDKLKTEVGQLQEEKEEVSRKSQEDVETYKEQVRQHSVTICTMEERLAKLNKRNKDYIDEVSLLKSANTELTAELERRAAEKPALPPKPKVIIERPVEEMKALEHVVALLREENVELKKTVTEQQDVIMGLRRDLAGASARLSDISGEMSESQKQEMEKNRELLCRRDNETTELRQQMAKLSAIIDKQKEDIATLQQELSQERSVCVKYRGEVEERSSQLVELETRLREEKEEQRRQLDLLDQEGRITSELVGIGAQCRGERHDQIITRQREALAELRSRVKVLEQSKAPVPTPDQALQQVVMLKKELAEIRANQALAEDKVLAAIATQEGHAPTTRSALTGGVNPEAEMERGAHRETMDTLEKSEQTFLTLLRAMAGALELEEIQGLRTIAHMPRDEREVLVAEREAACTFISNRIQVLKERVARKDELLQGYEHDLAKLRQSQEIAEKKAAQVDNLTQDVRSRAEESQYLRESLNRTRDKLNQEKRLNTAIKQKKTFHLENEKAHLRPQSAGRSRTQEQQVAAVTRKKVQRELMKRKNYEIQTLKGELCDKEQALFDREKRLLSLETSLGLERPVEVLE